VRAPTTEERFEAKYTPDPNTGCWNWTAFVNSQGYGAFSLDGKAIVAHRVSYMMFVGPIPAEICVCHKCDNPGCVNPDHLFLGTRADNMRDKVVKGRQARGENQGNARLTESVIRAIREDSRLQKDIASDYGVTQKHIGQIKLRRCWVHVE